MIGGRSRLLQKTVADLPTSRIEQDDRRQDRRDRATRTSPEMASNDPETTAMSTNVPRNPCRARAMSRSSGRMISRTPRTLIRNEFEERTWQALWRTTVDGRSPAEVAGELNMTAGAVRVAKSRVLRRLRQELGDL
jgi:DNA-directed RNA polymerase specialized sigma24 family protein